MCPRLPSTVSKLQLLGQPHSRRRLETFGLAGDEPEPLHAVARLRDRLQGSSRGPRHCASQRMFVAGSLAEAARRSVLTPLRPSPLIRARCAAARGHSSWRGTGLLQRCGLPKDGRTRRAGSSAGMLEKSGSRLGQPLNLGRHVLHAALFATPLGRGLPMRLHSRPIALETRRSTVATVPKGEAWCERPLLGRWKWADGGHAGLG